MQANGGLVSFCCELSNPTETEITPCVVVCRLYKQLHLGFRVDPTLNAVLKLLSQLLGSLNACYLLTPRQAVA